MYQEKLSQLGRLSESSVSELTDLYSNFDLKVKVYGNSMKMTILFELNVSFMFMELTKNFKSFGIHSYFVKG